MTKQIDIKSFSDAFRHARGNRIQMSTQRLGDILNISERDIIRFEDGQDCLPAETLELIFGAGMMMIAMACEHRMSNTPYIYRV